MAEAHYDLDEATFQRWVSRTVLTAATSQGLTQQRDLARALGWTHAYLSQKVTGRSKWSLFDIKAVAVALNIGETQLMNGWDGRVPVPDPAS